MWFMVKDDGKYRARGLKGLGMDVKQAWSKVYKKVAEAMEEIIGALGTAENKALKIALADHHHVNWFFDLLGLIYPDWPSVELKDAEVGKTRKRARASDTLSSTSKRGGRGRGCARGSKVDRVAVVKVVASSAASSMVAARPMATVSLAP